MRHSAVAPTPAKGDPAMIAGYLGSSDVADKALAEFAMANARQTALDHAKLVASPLARRR